MGRFSKANRHLYARGVNLRNKMGDQPDTNAVNAFLDGLDEDDRLSLSYAQDRRGTSGLVDLADEDNVKKARFLLALRIRRGKKLNESVGSETERSTSFDEESRRDMDLASEWESNGGTDLSRRSSLPSILSRLSRSSSRSTAKTRRVSFSSDTTGGSPLSTISTDIALPTPTPPTPRSTSTRQTRRTTTTIESSATAKSKPPERPESIISLSRFACCN